MNNIITIPLKSNIRESSDLWLLKFSPKLFSALKITQLFTLKFFYYFALIIVWIVLLYSAYTHLVYALAGLAGVIAARIVADIKLADVATAKAKLRKENENLKERLLNSYQAYKDVYLDNEGLEAERSWMEQSRVLAQEEINRLERELSIHKKMRDHYRDLWFISTTQSPAVTTKCYEYDMTKRGN